MCSLEHIFLRNLEKIRVREIISDPTLTRGEAG